MFSPIQSFCQRLGLPGIALGDGPTSLETQGHFLGAHPEVAKITVTMRTMGGFSQLCILPIAALTVLEHSEDQHAPSCYGCHIPNDQCGYRPSL